MEHNPIDAYLAELDEPKRSTLEDLRRTLVELLPEGEQVISYGAPAIKVNGKAVAGFAAFKNHLSYLPHSGSVLGTLHEETAGYSQSKSALRFPVDEPLPRPLVEALVAARLAEIQ